MASPIQPSVQSVNHELVTFPIQSLIRFLKHYFQAFFTVTLYKMLFLSLSLSKFISEFLLIDSMLRTMYLKCHNVKISQILFIYFMVLVLFQFIWIFRDR